MKQPLATFSSRYSLFSFSFFPIFFPTCYYIYAYVHCVSVVDSVAAEQVKHDIGGDLGLCTISRSWTRDRP
ncbi:hypothetical protein M752DRAFT_93477 [Aspergillus phoenicis ATCC 13157]|uniref:Uncharacterized protein n=1 Tax=Aspergillus phoenicis ATCC 13157 TaxID=1353007 RepID=A0A370P5T5_ASPPH|nr:hypothetical protein M752DRAFT_93477 [Aspergillus phoenicis ATCC 13157]